MKEEKKECVICKKKKKISKMRGDTCMRCRVKLGYNP